MYTRSGTILVAGLLILSCTLVPMPASAQDAAVSGYTIIDLGTLGGASSVAHDLNDTGQIVGNSDTASGQQHAFAWENGVMTRLVKDDIDATASSAAAINASGQIAGCIDVLSDRSPVLWDKGMITHLPTGTGYNCAARAINSAGQAVGSCYCVGPAYLRSCAVKWDSGVLTNFGAGSSASAINNRGQVVGTRYTGSGSYHASLWENGLVTDLGTPGEGYSFGVDINERGQVVGYSGYAFLWKNGVITELGTLGGAISRAVAINEQGQVVGKSTTAAVEEHAFL
jgi:probable HAF family extracellular repeat protein